MQQERAHRFARVALPHPRVVPRGGHHAAPVRTERDGVDTALVLQRCTHGLADVGLPHARGVVVRGGHYAAPVRTERDGVDTALVLQRCTHGLAGVGLPHPRGLVVRGGHHAAPVGTPVVECRL
jgi:hypothetical protein